MKGKFDFFEVRRRIKTLAAAMRAEGEDPTQPHNLFKIIRRSRGLSQREVAEAVGTSQAYLSRFERGTVEPSFNTLARLFHEGLGERLGLRLER